jgi:hypothetical protein
MIFLITAFQLAEIIDMDYHGLQTLDLLKTEIMDLNVHFLVVFYFTLCGYHC